VGRFGTFPEEKVTYMTELPETRGGKRIKGEGRQGKSRIEGGFQLRKKILLKEKPNLSNRRAKKGKPQDSPEARNSKK